MKKKPKKIESGESRALKFALYHNRLFRHKVIKNKKKEVKKFNLKKELSPYLSFYLHNGLGKGLLL